MSLGREYVQPTTQAKIREIGFVITHQEYASLKVLIKRIKTNLLQSPVATELAQQYLDMMLGVLEQVKVPPSDRSDIELTTDQLDELETLLSQDRFKQLL